MNIAQVVRNLLVAWAWATVTSVNFVGIVQQCVPMKIAIIAKIVAGNFVILVVNVPFVHLIISVIIVAIAMNVPALFVVGVTIAVIAQQFAQIVRIAVANVKTYANLAIDAKTALVQLHAQIAMNVSTAPVEPGVRLVIIAAIV